MSKGYVGKVLKVDLSSNRMEVDEPEDAFYRHFFGGMGFIGFYLLNEVKSGIDPLGPENILIYATGVVTGAPLSGSGRNAVGAKSPLTGGYGESDVGGYWGSELKFAGFDAIIVRGRADEPSFLLLHDGEAEIRSASHLWGKEVGESHKAICEELDDERIRTAIIGIAGERLVRYAGIIHDVRHAAGRTGMGAVMGSKNLKAIAVRGHRALDFADRARLSALARWMAQNVEAVASSLHKWGTGGNMDAFEATGNLPIRNYRDGGFPNVEAISAPTLKEKYGVGVGTCYACVVRCKKEVKVDEPWNVDPFYGGPEYETLASLGSNCGIDRLEAICKANQICSRYGVDTISLGSVVAFTMECYEKGLLSKDQTDGLELKFGDSEVMLELVEKVVKREGVGDLLAEGVKKAAEKIGGEAAEYAMHVRGNEIPMHEPRYKKGLGLMYCVGHVGADHCLNMHDNSLTDSEWDDLRSLGVSEVVPREDLGSKKVRLVVYYTLSARGLNNCLMMCDFVRWSLGQKIEIVEGVTGWKTTSWELMKVSERALTLARIFNLREGLTARDDRLPDRFHNPTQGGPLSQTAVDPKELQDAKRLYYGMMGWDEETGVPKRWKLDELDIGWAFGMLPAMS